MQVLSTLPKSYTWLSHEKSWTWLKKGNFKRETESIQIAVQNTAIRSNQIKARIDKTQQENKCNLRGDRDESINNIISECRNLAQKVYKTRHDWVGKLIHREMCNKFKFDHTNKGVMHNPASLLENYPHKLLWDFSIWTDPLCLARPYNYQQKKRTCKIVDFAVPSDHGIKLKESEKKDRYFDLARKLKRKWNKKVTIIPTMIGAFCIVRKELLKVCRTWRLKDEWRTSKLQHYWKRPEY